MVDLTNCDREPIHIPGAIQPHGALLVLQPDLTIVQVSANITSMVGRSPEDLLNQPLATWLSTEQVTSIQTCLQADFEYVNPLHIRLHGDPKNTPHPLDFDGIVHQFQDNIILELEPKQDGETQNFFGFYRQIKSGLTRIQKADTVLKMSQAVVAEIQRLTGFERVMVYRFDRVGAGQVIAEVVADRLNPYLDLCYPPSDIPQQARHLYQLNWLRIIPDSTYQPVPLIPTVNPVTQQPTDLSLSVLRSVSPIHLEYLHNMGVTASLSISLIANNTLWGLIACHHSQPQFIPYSIRTACEFLGQAMSLELRTKEANEDLDYKIKLQSVQSQFVESLPYAESLVEGLTVSPENLLALVSAQGAAIVVGERIILVGDTPSQTQVQQLVAWSEQENLDNIFYTHALSDLYLPGAEFAKVASGIIALTISRTQQTYILWFRPEIVQTVKWGGNPNKPVEVNDDGALRLSPRKSFEMWQETVRGRSLPWKTVEIEAVTELRSAIISIVLRHADELAAINLELQRSNTELDAFAYVASHDLKEPLRGIHNYSSFLLEDYGEIMDADGISKLHTLIRLTQRMEDLINSLLHYSRLGRVELRLEPINLEQIVQQGIETVKISYTEPIAFKIPRPLPMIQGDYTQILELFTNLFSNAIKYNDNLDKWVEIGYLGFEDAPPFITSGTSEQPPPLVFYVKDNGIGIRRKHLELVFRIFKRLHGPNQYGGGTGAGLTIVKKIVERHGGEIWLDSTVGEGSTFYFTIPTS
ncbi:MAG: ATP-binding protein [Jaaginema sp. PMC 1079.18]|nr:ATP-binding protein [Jaaginema sp. PMC 1080.18]MEC4849521.1 ATP-binding protein [Jaaginema sp. PMC 1079.18]MEC4865600.1 ATP-binding protein [Jaaginema sp. PMC 1078.18]